MKRARPSFQVAHRRPSATIRVRMNSSAVAAASARSARLRTRAAIARPRIISAFQLVRIFSSRPGQTRVLRCASNFARPSSSSRCAVESGCPVAAAISSSERHTRRCQCSSKLGSWSRPKRAAEHGEFRVGRPAPSPAPASRRRSGLPRPRNPHPGSSRTRRLRCCRRRRADGTWPGGGERMSRSTQSAVSAAIRRKMSSPLTWNSRALERQQRAVVVEHLLEVRDGPRAGPPSSGRSRRPAGRRCRPRPCASA